MAYIIGILAYLYCNKMLIQVIVVVIFLLSLFIIILMNTKNYFKIEFLSRLKIIIKENFSKKDFVFFLIPLFFLLGYSSISKCEHTISIQEKNIDYLIEKANNDKVFLYGKLCDIEKKDKTYMLVINTNIGEYTINDSINIGKDISKDRNDYIAVYIDKEIVDGINVGNEIMCKGSLVKYENASNEGNFDEYNYYVKEKSYACKMFVKSYSLLNNKTSYKNRLINIRNKFENVFYSCLSKKDASTINAMLLGDKNSLDKDTKSLYKNNGIAHIIAISGLHISIIGMGLFNLLKKIKFDIYLNALFCSTLILLYGLVTGASIATIRAVIMLITSFFAVILGRKYDMLSGLSLSALIILFINPYQLFTCSMLLSFMAVLAIQIVYPMLRTIFIKEKKEVLNDEKIYIDEETGEYIDKRFVMSVSDIVSKLLDFLKEALCLSISINMVTLPIILFFYYEFGLISILINIIVVPLMTFLIVVAIITCFLGLISNVVGIFFAGSIHYILSLYELLCKIGEKIKFDNILTGYPCMIVVVIYYSILIFFLLKANIKKIYCMLAITVVLFLINPVMNFISNDISITMLDVGQGDGIFIRSKRNTTIMIDGGSSSKKDLAKYSLVPFLKYKGVKTIDYQVITHSDSDHISGVSQIIKNDMVTIKNLILPYINKKDENYIQLENLAKANNIKISYIKKGDSINLGQSEESIVCLHPSKDYKVESANGYSTVLHYKYKEFDMLFTGDLEKDGEELVKKELEDKNYKLDILKVAHHGSKNSSTKEFLQEADPTYAVISAGKNNRYHHPHKETLERLKAQNIKYYSTQDKGSIEIVTNGNSIKIYEGIKKSLKSKVDIVK